MHLSLEVKGGSVMVTDSKQPILLILVGPPGSGKSTYAVGANDYYRVSQDDQGKEGHWGLFQKALDSKKNIVVDRMNFSKEQRERYAAEARHEGYYISVMVLHESYDTCLARCLARTGHPTIQDEKSARSALHTFFTKYERPVDGDADRIEYRYPSVVREEVVICDLDGTLCNLDHRLHYVQGEGKKDWKRFFERCYLDSPNKWCKELIKEMYVEGDGYQIILCSGRPEDLCRSLTEEWLKKNEIGYSELLMRRRGDFRRDDVVKEIILDFEILTRYNILFVIDDRKQVVEMWRRRGITCLQCADGEF